MKGVIFGFLTAIYLVPALAVTPSRLLPDASTKDSTTNATSTTERGRSAESATRTVSSRTTATTGSNTASTATTASRTATTRRTARTVMPTDKTNATTRTVARTSAATRADGAGLSDTSRGALTATMHTGGRSTRTEGASINANPAVRRLGLTLRPSTAEVGGRAIIAGTDTQTGSNMSSEIRNVSSRAASSTSKLTASDIAAAKDQLEQMTELNKSCQEQYNDCMDQFCAVIDANQKRCSCSANLSKYTKIEEAVKNANAKLNEEVQKIRLLGLTESEIKAINSATEAEDAMDQNKDNTTNRKMLEGIADMIKDPKASSKTGLDSYGLLDIDLDFENNDWGDLFSLDFLSGDKTFSNLRGSELYNAAKKRCKVIINQCKEVGATADQITGNYDLAIDKDCIAYETGLSKMNDSLRSNVRSAVNMLQKGRLAVLENHNEYNARECVAALEECMTDDMVCGSGYTKCIDPTKMFVDENGNVVLGKNINMVKRYTDEYDNSKIDSSFLSTSYGTTVSNEFCSKKTTETGGNDGRCNVKFLLNKIGTKADATAEGLCRPVLDKCRAYTYDNDKSKYIPYNDIVINYIQRAMVNIRSAQYRVVADYASTCLTDIAECYNDQVSQLTTWSETAAAGSVYNILRGACRNVALTCAYAVFSADSTSCPAVVGDDNIDTTQNQNKCIESISNIFYQSLLCPDNSVYRESGSSTIDMNNTPQGWVNAKCQCKAGFVVFNSQCLPACDNGADYTSAGVCDTNQSCPADSVEDTTNPEFWGFCRCNSGLHWFPNYSACKTCPGNSSYNSSGTASEYGLPQYNHMCECDTGYFMKTNSSCRKCPDGADVSSDKKSCDCPAEKPYFCPGNGLCNASCETNANSCPAANSCLTPDDQQPGTAVVNPGGGSDSLD